MAGTVQVGVWGGVGRGASALGVLVVLKRPEFWTSLQVEQTGFADGLKWIVKEIRNLGWCCYVWPEQALGPERTKLPLLNVEGEGFCGNEVLGLTRTVGLW